MKQDLIDLVCKLKNLDEKQQKYLAALPSDIRDMLIENQYVLMMGYQRDLLIKRMFGKMAEDVEWFLYEFEAGKSPGPHCIMPDNTSYTYNTNEDYYQYLREQDD